MSSRDDSASLGGRVAAFTVLGLVVLVGGVWLGLYVYAGDRAPRSAKVEGVSIAGLGPVSAEQKLRRALAGRIAQPIQVSYGDGRTRAVDPGDAGLSVDYAGSVEAAGGGGGWSPQRLWEVASGGSNHRAVVDIDEVKMQSALDSLSSGIAQPPVNGTVTFTGGQALGVPGRPGQVVDRSAAEALLVARFLHQGSQKLPTLQARPVVTADEVNRVIGSFGEPALSAPVTILVAGQRVVAPPRLFARALSVRVEDGTLVPQVDAGVLMRALSPVMPTIGTEPVDARVEVRDRRPVVVPARLGIVYDADALESGFAVALTRHGADRRVVVPGQVRQPAFTTAAAVALRVTRPVSTFTTRFPYAGYRNTNLARAATLVDGTLLRPGETFSLNAVLGERSRTNGFTDGNVADGVVGTDTDGGVSPLATSLFNAMFFAGLQDVEHTATRVHATGGPVGREATVVWPSADLRFTDDSPYGVLVTAAVTRATPRHQGSVTVSMWSTRRWDITARTGPRTQVRQPSVRYVRTGGCQPVAGTPGFGVDVVRVFRAPRSGKVVRTQTFHTDYQAGDAVRCGQPPRT